MLSELLASTLGKAMLTVMVLGGASYVAGWGTYAAFSAETRNPTNEFGIGTLVLSNRVGAGTACLSTSAGSTDANANSGCDTAFDLAVKKPGDSGSADLTIKNAGSVAATTFNLFTGGCADSDDTTQAYHGSGSLCTKVQVYLQEFSDTFSTPSKCWFGGGTATTCDFSDAAKTLGVFDDYVTGARLDLTGGGSGGLAAAGTAGDTRYFRIGVKLPSDADNAYQGRKAVLAINWHSAQ